MYSEELRKALQQYISVARKFGPHQAEIIASPECRAAFFEYHYTPFRNMLVGSDMVVGRRGSGKTSLLNVHSILPYLQTYHEQPMRSFLQENRLPMKIMNDRYLSVPLNLADEFVFINKVIADQNITGSPPIDFLVKFWRLRMLDKVRKTIETYLIQNDMADRFDITQFHNKLYGVDDVDITEYNHDLARRLTRALAALEKEAIVTVDTVDDQIDLLKHNRNIFGALLKTASEQISAPLERIHFKVAIPLEAFQETRDAVSNPDKVLFDIIYLNWSAWHLLRIALHRLRLYYFVLRHEGELARTKEVDLTVRQDVLAFWSKMLPPDIQSIRGMREPTATYMLRHTQLIPRQLIMILNRAALLSHPFQDNNELRLTEQSIREASNEVDKTNAEACLGQFEKKYSGIQNLVATYLKNVPRFGDYKQYHRAWAKGSYARRFREICRPLERPDNFDGFLQLLWEIGVVGRCSDSNSGSYVVGEFRFNIDSDLQATERNRLCVHPMFSRAWRCIEIENDHRGVLPVGTDAYSSEE